MYSKHELENTRLKCTKLQNQKTGVILNYYSPFITKMPTYLKTPKLKLNCCVLVKHFAKNQKQGKNKVLTGGIYKINVRTIKHLCGPNTLNIKQYLQNPNHP
jgi:hypothetical protein